jgi:hypothetical protein
MRHLPKLETFDVASVCPRPFARETLATLRGNVTVSCLLPSFFRPLQSVSFPNLRFFLHFFSVAGLTGSKYRRSFLSDRTRQARVCLLSQTPVVEFCASNARLSSTFPGAFRWYCWTIWWTRFFSTLSCRISSSSLPERFSLASLSSHKTT